MARIDNLDHFLTDVANAIRTKKSSQDSIQASSFDTAILSIPTGGGGQTDIYKVATIQERNALSPNEDDICLVYANNLTNLSTDTVSAGTTITFPNAVTITLSSEEEADLEENLSIYSSLDYTGEYYEEDPETGEYSVYISQYLSVSVNIDDDGEGGRTGYADIIFERQVEVDGNPDNIYETVSYSSDDGINFVKSGNTQSITIPSAYDVDLDFATGEYENIASSFGNIGGIEFNGIFQYKNSTWGNLKIDIPGNTKNILTGKKSYTDAGTITGDFPNLTNINDAKRWLELENAKYVLPQDCTELFRNSAMKYFNLPVDSSAVTITQQMFTNCTSLTEFHSFDTSNVTNMSAMFASCTSLTDVPLFDTSSVTDMSQMFGGCRALTTVPLFDTSNVTDMSAMFSGCRALTEIPLFDTSNVTNMYFMFVNCTSLTTIPQFDTSSITNMSTMFGNNCSSLTNQSLNNILGMCAGATNYNGTKTLKFLFNNADMSTYYPAATIQSLSNYQAFTAAGWTIGW